MTASLIEEGTTPPTHVERLFQFPPFAVAYILGWVATEMDRGLAVLWGRASCAFATPENKRKKARVIT
jgi:hypothetical protein